MKQVQSAKIIPIAHHQAVGLVVADLSKSLARAALCCPRSYLLLLPPALKRMRPPP